MRLLQIKWPIVLEVNPERVRLAAAAQQYSSEDNWPQLRSARGRSSAETARRSACRGSSRLWVLFILGSVKFLRHVSVAP